MGGTLTHLVEDRGQRCTLSYPGFEKTTGGKAAKKRTQLTSQVLLKRTRRGVFQRIDVGASLSIVRIKNSRDRIAVGLLVVLSPAGDILTAIVQGTNFASVILRHEALSCDQRH